MARTPSSLNRKVLQNIRTTKLPAEIEQILSGVTAIGEIAVQMGDNTSGVGGTSLWTLAADGETAVQFVNKTYVDAVVGQTDIPVAQELDSIEQSVGLQNDGTLISGETSVWGTETKYFNSATTVVDAVKELDTQLSTLSGYVADSDFELAKDDNKVVVSTKQEDGRVSATSEYLTSVKLSGYVVGGDDSGKLEDTDTLGEALGKLQGQINGMDKQASSGVGQVVITVSEEDGKVAEQKSYLKDVTLSGYSKTANTGAISESDTLEVALSKLENTVGANEIINADGSINVTPDVSGKTEINVNIKSDEKVLAKDGNAGLYTDIKIESATTEEVAALGSNVREAYKLTATNGDRLGEYVKIYKDSSLDKVELGHIGDLLQGTTAITEESTSDTIVPDATSSAECFNIVYILESGKYKMVQVPLEDFLQEAEFKDGLQVSQNHEVSVKKDATSEKVILDYAAGTSGDVLTVSSEGVKIANIQAAIDAAVGKAQTSINTEVAQSAETAQHLFISAHTADNGQVEYGFTTVDIASEDELKATQAGAGLEDGGAYAANTATTYLGEATSLKDADEKLDAALDAEVHRATSAETQLDAVIGAVKGEGEARTYGHAGTTYLDGNTTVKADAETLDALLGAYSGNSGFEVKFSDENTVAKNISDIKKELAEATASLTLSSTTETPVYIETSVASGATGTTVTINALRAQLAAVTGSSVEAENGLVDAWDAKQYFIHTVEDYSAEGLNKINVSVVSGSTGEQIIDFTNMVVDCGTF